MIAQIKVTTLDVVRRAAFTSLVTDQVPVTATIIRSSSVSEFSFVEHFSTSVSQATQPDDTKGNNAANKSSNRVSPGLIVGLTIGLASLLVVGFLLFLLYRRRRRTRTQQSPSDTDTTSRTSFSKVSPFTAPSVSPPPPIHTTIIAPRTAAPRVETPEQLPRRTDTGSPLGEPLPPLAKGKSLQPPKLSIPRRISVLRRPSPVRPPTPPRISAPYIPPPKSPIFAGFSPVAARNAAWSPIMLHSPTWVPTPLSPTRKSSLFVAPPIPYGYQSEYPEYVAGPTVVGPTNNEQELIFLQEEERLLKERVQATEELIKLKSQEAKLLERKRRIVNQKTRYK